MTDGEMFHSVFEVGLGFFNISKRISLILTDEEIFTLFDLVCVKTKVV